MLTLLTYEPTLVGHCTERLASSCVVRAGLPHCGGPGFFLGRTPLIKLSPKKTWEGFIGGLLLTLVASWYLSRYMSRFPWMVCERTVRSRSFTIRRTSASHSGTCAPRCCSKQACLR